MKTAALWTALMGVAALSAGVDATSGKNQPGYCKDDSTCTAEAANYTCVSVQTTRSGLSDVKECLPYTQNGDVCSGMYPGLCPSFSTWSTAFQSISTVCAYFIPDADCLTAAEEESSASSDGKVQCINITSEGTTYGTIYGCVDFDGTNLLFDTSTDSYKFSETMNYSTVITDGCINPSDSDVVCSGRGTCAPDSAGSMNYSCLCNTGYNGTYCQKIVSNACTNEAQCSAGTCDLTTKECVCDAGTTGDQCAECDPTSSAACNGHGTCGAGTVSTGSSSSESTTDGSGSTASNSSTSASDVGSTYSCVCNDGWSGDQCTRKSTSTKSGTSTGSSSSTSTTSDATSVAASVSAVVVSFLLLAAF